MAVGAEWGHGITPIRRGAMQAAAMGSRFAPVAIITDNRLEFFGVPATLAAGEVAMAFHTGQFGMHRPGDHLCSDIRRYLGISLESGQLRIVMTLETPAVFLRQRRTAAQA